MRQQSLMSCILVLLCSLAGQRANAQGDDLGNELVAAASRGDLPRVKALLAANADVNAKVNAKPVNGLRSVIVSGQARLVDGETALMLASREGHLEVVRRFVRCSLSRVLVPVQRRG